MNDNEFGYRIKIIRLNEGLTQEQLAKELDVKKSAVSNWEQGLNKPVKETLKKIADIAGLTVDELLNGKQTTVRSR